ncbi:MAG TPA: 30S ribosomal protein S6 [Acidimicrobiales bacterium]|jgi:small subunit ribosomal protein S6|nr:30S ribosomal protein S6 [Acidimicrobiales bacterium]
MLAPRAYELMVIIDAELDDEVIDATIKRIAGLLDQRGATVKSEDRWGRRRFAYEINHKLEGYYVLFEFVGGSDLDTLERALRLADETVRHKVVRLPDHEAARRGLVEQAAK